MIEHTDSIRTAYDAGATSWQQGPEAVYGRLARALVAESPGPLAGERCLDLGSGTGVASVAAAAVGAHPVGVDLSWSMLRQRFDERPPGVVANALHLPFRDDVFGAVVAAFCINHFQRPATALAECRRALRPGGVLLASSFAADREHPAKSAVEAVLVEHGYVRPDWYAAFKDGAVAATGSAESLAAAADDAGLAQVEAYVLEVDAGLDRPDAMVAWRFSMPQTIGFVEGLDDATRERLRADALSAVSTIDPPSTIAMIVLRARAA